MTRRTLSIKAGEETAARGGVRSWGLTGERLERLKQRARDERRTPTEAERILWEQVSGGQIGGLKFSRKAVVGPVIADFACPSRWVVVNLSPAGASAEVDALQDRKLTETGIRVLRFAEAQVLEDCDSVIAAIKDEVNKPFDRRTAQAQAGARLARIEE